MADFLLELRSEEIPARMQKGARGELEKLFRREMDAAGVAVGDLAIWSTPRRLALIARNLPTKTEAVREEAKGPPIGAPDQAVDGFCRKNGVSRDQLEERELKGRATYFAVIERPGQLLQDILAIHLPLLVYRFSWPKSMRWGEHSISTESLRWVRPLSSVLALLDDEPLEINFDGANVYVDAKDDLHFKKFRTGLISSNKTVGHRFHSSGEIEIGHVDEYADKLREACVIVDHGERAGIIREGARKAAKAAGLTVVEDEGLVVENAGLTEWPVPLLGRFDEAFLDVPPEVIQLTARVNQKYFVCEERAPDGTTRLANAFICTANIAAEDSAVVVDGNRKVLAARLADARFFWELDQKKTLASHAEGLERITFHEKLGTLADKVDRVAKLAEWLAAKGLVPNCDPKAARQAAELCKADLVTEMVGEFPELQGLMGGYYAEKEGLPREVSEAIRNHYKPVGQGDEAPTAPVTVAVSLADKLDSLCQFFLIDEVPTGSKDPFALRRAVLGVIATILHNGLRFRLQDVLTTAVEDDLDKFQKLFFGHTEKGLADFFADRLKVQQREAGVRHDLIDAVFALGREDDLVRLLARVEALQAFIETENGTNLLAGYKRAANILKKENFVTPANAGVQGEGSQSGDMDSRLRGNDTGGEDPSGKDLSYTPEPSEKALLDALDAAAPKAASAVEAEDFEAAMAALATLRAPIDAFFDNVIVNDPDADKRAARLALLARFRDAVHQVADFSRIEG